ncbi:MAG: hypothetical protein WCJ67_05320 [Thermoleophilia bacterium]
MMLFGSRDSGADDSLTAGALPLRPALDGGMAPPMPSTRVLGAPDIRRVILRVNGDDDIVVGSAEGRDNAVQMARNLVLHIEQASTKGEWPRIDERFIRPGAIVSIDVQRSG